MSELNWRKALADRGILDVALSAGWRADGAYWRYPVPGCVAERGKRMPNTGEGAKYIWYPAKPTDRTYYYSLTDTPRPTMIRASGEPDVLAYAAVGVTDVFCWFDGEVNVPDSLVEDLKRWGVTKVIDYPDVDKTGRDSAAKLMAILSAGGIEYEPHVLPELESKFDINKLWIACKFDPEVFQDALIACEIMKIEPSAPAEFAPSPLPNHHGRKADKSYGQAALEAELAILAAATVDRNNQLNTSAFALGQLIGGGALNESDVRAALYQTALSIGLNSKEAGATISSGLKSGIRQPRYVDDNPAPKGKRAAAKVEQSNSAPTASATLSIAELATQAQKQAQGWQDDPQDIRGFRTGVRGLDNALHGLVDNDILVIIGRTGSGKSTFAVQLICEFAAYGPGLVFTTELAPTWYVHRMASFKSRLALGEIYAGKAGKGYLNTYEALSSLPLTFYMPDNPTPEVLLEQAKIAKQRGDKWIMLDSLNNVAGKGTLYDRTGDTMDAIRSISRDMGMLIVATCQANRGPADRANKEPLLTDAQGGGVIEQVARRVLTIYRPGYDFETGQVKESVDDPRETWLRVAKDGQFGATGTRVRTLFEPGKGFVEHTPANVQSVDLAFFNEGID